MVFLPWCKPAISPDHEVAGPDPPSPSKKGRHAAPVRFFQRTGAIFMVLCHKQAMSYAVDTRPAQARFFTALFTWHGRMNRITYFFWFFLIWVVLSMTALIVAVAVSTGVALALDPSLMNRTGPAASELRGHPVLQLPTLIFFAFLALAITGTSAMMTKRLRDAGWPVWLMPPVMALLLLPAVAGSQGLIGPLGVLLFALLLMWPPSRPDQQTPADPPASTQS